MFDKLFPGRDWLVCCSVGGKMFDKLCPGLGLVGMLFCGRENV
jgi:hypothetical protein